MGTLSMKGMTKTFIFCLVSLFSVAACASSTFTLPSGVRVDITESVFQRSQFKVQGCGDGDRYCRINGRIPFGDAFGLPKTYVKAITVSYMGKTYSLDVSDMYDARGTRPLEFKGAIRYFGGKCSSSKDCKFRGLFSDGAGTFVAEWMIVDGVSTRTVLTDSDDVVDLFMRHIDPPVFDSQ
jgi:hypothetical protein